MREFIGNPNQVEYYEEDDVEVESEVYDDGADNFIYLDPSDMGIEIDDDDDVDVDDDADEDFESFSLGDHYSSEETDYIEDDEEEESLSDEVQELATQPSDRHTYRNNKNSDTDSDYTQSSDDCCTVIGESGDSSSN